MEDEIFKDIFNKFEPQLSSHDEFMANLKRNLNAVECIKQQQAAANKHNKIAIWIAAVSGFIIGALLTLLFPFIKGSLSTISINTSWFSAEDISTAIQVIVWAIIAITSCITAYNVYEISLYKLAKRATI
jgi:uncharacterized membrane protein YdbT with pleckstrin-like domain